MKTMEMVAPPEAATQKRTQHRAMLPVLGMTCASCASSVESLLITQRGVEKAAVNFASQTVTLTYAPDKVSLLHMQQVLQAAGFDLLIDTENATQQQEAAQQKHYRQLKRKTVWAAVLTLPVVVVGMFYMDMPYANWIMLVLSAPVIWLGRHFYSSAIRQARQARANMDTLVALSTGIAFLYSLFNTLFPHYLHSKGLHPHVYYESATVIIAFILLGKLLEERAKSSTSSAIRKLMGLQPKTVRLLENGTERTVPIATIKVGDLLVLRPGERVPVDGTVISGSSYVDESMISGEPVPVAKGKGSKVYAGTVNQKGRFSFQADKVGGETVLAQIIKMVQEAQGSKAPVQKLVDKIAGIFVPVVISIALLSFGAWLLLGEESSLTHALLAMVSVLVIACPCALGLATPTAIMVGVGKGAEHNILIKDAESLELGYRVNAVVLDKTGTITAGKPEVSNIGWFGEEHDRALHQSVLLAMEASSEHPLAEAIVAKLQDTSPPAALSHFESITGRGVVATYQGRVYLAGNRKLLAEHQVPVDRHLEDMANDWQEKAQTVIYFANHNGVLAVLSLADQVKPSSKLAIEALQKKDIELFMLTGDNVQTARAVAQEVGISHYRAELLPAGKAAFIQELQRRGKFVAMVGDGINDTHALAQADVSIAMGKGTDIAMDVAKITLMTSDLMMIPKTLALSHKTVRTIRQNLTWAFLYNVVGIPIAAGVLYPFTGFLLDPMLAGAAMALSSVSVVSNSLRLKSHRI
ncbi:heavy metal translocating P-type ATPase [Pontibacter sp. MBLB2868]|uniref:heavy metal translocating P-type ATPase n=1 Tax=Pontibacter sp. MBLB2868 TaxID=3451555 RepID=UPI003F74FB4E